ncbi:MAG TPA: Uma2 family endonuclease [Methylomirabilota bacterium]|jgi:Uma2 family endonuclease
MIAVKLLTYDDYAALPNDGKRYELLDGVLHVTAAPSRSHQRVVLRLAMSLETHVAANNLGEVDIAPFDVILSDPNVVEPDIIFVATDRMPSFSHRGFEGAPTLVVEVLSPSTARVDRNTKLQIYARHGVPYYWIVEPEARAIDVHTLAGLAYGEPERFANRLVDLPPFPGLTLDPFVVWP